ncbi:hypothetical protein CIHG_06986 [Coccidioides immitis H538.4]|uniref:Uncharacterized protein n=3 Tax=Coccidioides immitis TaxID=5501 RepID=A0A0J8R0I0_COCIT|nr:hypothetical protein CIRG_10030 [Coccidioides immitis RMSCC 2394]KMU77148.1 hypothetical protein CISG_06185 [Coccidioides immitis RMSCC 3703]KMU89313.1 hypothetical protein CIHG_06986 [Coccidioides immitis H538.4]
MFPSPIPHLKRLRPNETNTWCACGRDFIFKRGVFRYGSEKAHDMSVSNLKSAKWVHSRLSVRFIRDVYTAATSHSLRLGGFGAPLSRRSVSLPHPSSLRSTWISSQFSALISSFTRRESDGESVTSS